MAQDDDPIDDLQAVSMTAAAAAARMAETAARAAQVRDEKFAQGNPAATGHWPGELSRGDIDQIPLGGSVVDLRGHRYERVEASVSVDGQQIPMSWRDPATGKGFGFEDANSRLYEAAGPLYAGDGPEAARIFADQMNGADPAKAAATGPAGPTTGRARARGRGPVRTPDRGR